MVFMSIDSLRPSSSRLDCPLHGTNARAIILSNPLYTFNSCVSGGTSADNSFLTKDCLDEPDAAEISSRVEAKDF
jgi:hypothetical protein